jgi:hypothetical protein
MMDVRLQSTQVQQNFGRAMDRALRGDDVIVERYGTPRAAIVEYERYRRLVAAEHELLQARAEHASAAPSAPAHLGEVQAAYLVQRAPAEAQEASTAVQRHTAAPTSNADAVARSAGHSIEPPYRYVARISGICGGRPIIQGTRIPVRTIVDYHKLGMSVDDILDGLPNLTPAQVYEALSYYHDHQEAIEREIQSARRDKGEHDLIIVNRTLRELAEEYTAAALAAIDDNLTSVILFGSVARGEAGPQSDIDLLVICRKLSRSVFRRREVLEPIRDKLQVTLDHLWAQGWYADFSDIIRTETEAEKTHPLYLDMTEDGMFLFDRGGFFAAILARVRERLSTLGAQRRQVGRLRYWDLKPNVEVGETVAL